MNSKIWKMKLNLIVCCNLYIIFFIITPLLSHLIDMIPLGHRVCECCNIHERLAYIEFLILNFLAMLLFWGLKLYKISGGLWRCLYAGWWNEMESFATYAKAKLPYRVCMGNCQQFNYYYWRYNRKAPSYKKNDAGWRGLPI